MEIEPTDLDRARIAQQMVSRQLASTGQQSAINSAWLEQQNEAREAKYEAAEAQRVDREMRASALHAALAISTGKGADRVIGDARDFYAFLKGDQH